MLQVLASETGGLRASFAGFRCVYAASLCRDGFATHITCIHPTIFHHVLVVLQVLGEECPIPVPYVSLVRVAGACLP